MNQSIKINFVDFWPGFQKNNNYLFNTLLKHFQVTIDENPELLFYSCYGSDYLKFNCVRVFYASENVRPDFTACDYAMTFDFLNDIRHYRLPLYAFYIDQRNKWGDLLTTPVKDEMEAIWKTKFKFCCMVVSNGQSKKRIDFFKSLSKVKSVDSGGRFLNNIGSPVSDKLAFIREYKFVISFENSSFPGYTTEKLLDPLLENCIPIYWGNPKVDVDFNDKRFLNYDHFPSEKELIQEMISIEADTHKALKVLMEPVFPDNKLPACVEEENVILFLRKAFDAIGTFIPVGQTSKRFLHQLKRKKVTAQFYIDKILGVNFR